MVLWFANVPLLLSLLSIVLIMKLFYSIEQRYAVHPNNLLNVIGSNTIAIYTTHRILIEAFSLFLIGEMNAAYWPVWAELTLILVYPFASLLLCTVAGLGSVRSPPHCLVMCSSPRLPRFLRHRPAADALFAPFWGRISSLCGSGLIM